MNKSQAERWDHQLKEVLKKKWEMLTEEDFRKAGGSMFKLYGVIRVKLGDTGEIINKTPDHEDQN
jgi:hypothetical protein